MDNPQLIFTWLKVVVAIGAIITMIWGLVGVFSRLKAKAQGFGPNSLRAIGIVMFLPLLLLLALLTDFNTETLAALLGTVAGYVLSNSEPSKTE